MGLKSESTALADHNIQPRAYFVAIICLGLFLVVAVSIARFAYSENIPALYNVAFVQAPSIAAWLYALWMIRQNKRQHGIEVALAVLLVVMPLNSIAAAGIGWVIGIATIVGVIAVAGLLLPAARTQRWLVAAIVSGAISVSLDLIGSPERPVINFPAQYVQGLVEAILLILGFLIAMGFRSFSLRTKLITVFVGLAVLSTVGITFIATQAIRNTLTENGSRDLRTRAQAAALAIGITMDRNVDRLLTMSLDKRAQNDVALITDSYPAVESERAEIISRNVARWATADPQDTVIQNALNGQLAYSLRQFGDVFQGNQEVFMTDAYGSVIAATDWQPHYNFAQDGWWQNAYNGGRGAVHIGQPEFNPMINEYGIRIALPIYSSGRQRVVGVLHSIFTLTALQRALLLNSFGQSGKIDLLFPQGQILTSEGTFRALKPEEFAEIKGGISQPLATLNYRGTPLLSSQGVVGVSDEQPEPYLRSSAWRTIATVQSDEALAAVDAGAQAALFGGLVTIVVAALVALLLAQFLTRPIRRLTNVAEQVQEGDLGARAQVETGDEIGTLAQTFNSMTARLQDTLSSLEHRVTERTEELSKANLSLQSNSSYLSALSDTSAGLFERLDLKDLLRTILERAGALMGTQNGFVFFVEPDRNDIQMRVGSGVYDDLVGTRAQAGVGLAGTVWQTGEVMIIEDYQKWEGRLPGSRRDALRAIVAVPLKRGAGKGSKDDETVGVIGLAYTEEGRNFGKTEVEILQRFAQLASIALDNAQLYENAEIRFQELESLNGISRIVAQENKLIPLIEKVGNEMCQIFGTDFAYVALLDPVTEKIEFPYVIDDGKRVSIPSLTLGEGLTSQVISSRQPMRLTNANEAEYTKMGAVDSGDGASPESLLTVPMESGDRVIGALSVQRIGRERGFTLDDQRLLTTMAASVSIGIENARLAQATLRQLDELSALSRIGAALNAPTDLNLRLRQVGLELVNIFQVSGVYISLYDAPRNTISTPFFIENGIEDEIPTRQHERGLVSHIINTREALLINENMPQRFEELGGVWIGTDDTQMRSYLGVPLVAGDQMLGVVALNDLPEKRFTDADTRFLSTIAGAIASAIQNERLAQATQQRLAELAALNKISTMLTSDQSLTERFGQVGRELHAIFDVSSVYIALYDAPSNTVRMPFFMGDDQEYTIEPFALGPGFTSHILHTRAPLLINDDMDAQMEAMQAMKAGEGDLNQSYLGVPIHLGDQALGVVGLSAPPKNKFQESDARLLNTIASAVGSAIQNSRLLEQTQERAREMDAINSLAREITQQRSLDDLFHEVYLQAKSVTAVDGVLISLYDAPTDTLTVPFLMDEGQRYDITPDALELEREYAEQTRKGESVVINSTPEEVEELEKSPAVAGNGRASRSRLYVPLMAGVRFLGMISLHSYAYNAYSERDVSVLSGLASHIAVALENARLFEQTQDALAETNRLYRLAEAANLETSELAFYKQVHEIVGEAMDAQNFYIALYDETSHTLDFPYFVDARDTLPDLPLRHVNAGKGSTAYVLRTRQPLLGTEADMKALEEKGEMEQQGSHAVSWLGVPMLRGDRVIGVVVVQSYDPAIHYTERDQRSLINLSQGIANIIERKHSEDALRASEARKAAVLETAHDCIISIDHESKVLEFNPAAEKTFGYTQAQALGQNIADLIMPPSYREQHHKGLAKYLETGHGPVLGKRIELVGMRADGAEFPIELAVTPIRSGEKPTFTAHLRDITERKRAETELQVALGETRRLATRERDAAEQVSALNRRLTREGWRDYLDQLNSHLVVEAGGEEDGSSYTSGLAERNGGARKGDNSKSGGSNGQPKINVPIMLRGEVIGEIELEPEDAAVPMSAEEMGLVTHVAENIGLALDNARLFTETQRRVTELDALNRISQAVTTELDLDALLNLIGDQLRTIFDVQNSYIALYDRETQMIALPYFVNDNQRVAVEPIPFGEGITSHIIRTRTHLVLNENTDREMEKLGARVFGNPARSYLGVPIFVGDNVTGVISIQSTTREGMFDDSNVRLLETIAATVGAAIQNAQLYGAMQQEVVTRQRAEAEITLSLKEKEVLLKEIHHRVKNNLQIITSLLNLQSAQIKDPEAATLFRESQARVRSMALIHEKLYQSKDLARIDFDSYVRDLMVYLFRSYAANPDQIRPHIATENMFLAIDTAIPCGLIISELVTNAIKYAFPNGKRGNLYITVQPEDDGHLMLLVQDDGVGFPEGFDWRASDSLGLQLVSTLSAQLHGTIEVNGTGGTSFKITFPG